MTRIKQYVNSSKKVGELPAIACVNPKYRANLGMAVRLASSYGIKQLWFTGNRINLDSKARVPREERLKQYMDVEIWQGERFFNAFDNAIPVAVELVQGAQDLTWFEHPSNALYVFGPEDGGLTSMHLSKCHHIVQIPSKHCLNVATAIATILYDRHYKERITNVNDR